MITIRVEAQQFRALCAGFHTAADDPDALIDRARLMNVRAALADASATALPGLPILVMLQSTGDLAALAACFEVGGDGHPDVADDQWDSVLALIEQASRSTPD
jgi:hypothetical protein